MANKLYLILFIVLTFSAVFAQGPILNPVVSEFIYGDKAGIPSCHASTLVELDNGDILASWFGGEDEGEKSVEIWLSRRSNGKWSKPQQMTDYPNQPTWNPVLFRDKTNQIWLFFKVGPSPTEWTGAYRTSKDNGKSWSDISLLPAGLLGPIKNKPIQLENGDIVNPTSVEAWRVWTGWAEISSDGGENWEIGGPIKVPDQQFGVIQPTFWEYAPGKLRALLRSRNIGFIVESNSNDGGKTWTPGKIREDLPHPGSGIDAVRMSNKNIALIYNHTHRGRSPINLAFSKNNGDSFGTPYILEDIKGEFSYPAIIQAKDGKLHMTYTWRREKIKYVVIDPNGL
jgi:predicted neuraminidase